MSGRGQAIYLAYEGTELKTISGSARRCLRGLLDAQELAYTSEGLRQLAAFLVRDGVDVVVGTHVVCRRWLQ